MRNGLLEEIDEDEDDMISVGISGAEYASP
jgi:hypothetical protein